MLTLSAAHKYSSPSRFGWLMGLHGENYHRLARLFAPQRLAIGSYLSSVDDRLDVMLEIIEHHPYTIDMSLTYAMTDSQTGVRVPSARIRMYRDARMAEVLSHHADQQLERAIGPLPPARTVFEKRVRCGSFLNRWLEYLAEQGHSMATLASIRPAVTPVRLARLHLG